MLFPRRRGVYGMMWQREKLEGPVMLELQAAVAKVGKYASPESGDTIEMIERPKGGFSLVMVDGQGSGRGAKTLSNLVTARAVAMLKDGARDGAVARAVHDYLFGYRKGV